MDYILGRNALNQSYVTGYGEHAAQNQHSRIFAHQLDPACRTRRAGSLAGGPNAGLQDPFARQAARRLRAAVLLRRRHRVVVDQRGGDQLELGAGLDRVVPGRPG